MSEQNNNTPDETIQQDVNAPAPTDLNITDLLALRNILDVASQRGAFKAAEMESVGKTYNKLNLFLESISKKEA
jgi:hypothetical protein